MTAERDDFSVTAFPLAFNTRDGKPLDNAGVFRDAEGNWWSIQARKVPQLSKNVYDMRDVRALRQDEHGRVGHISMVRLPRRPVWLTANDKSNLRVALELNALRYSKDIKLYRTQDEADEEWKQAHEARELFVKRGR
ncbi:MAG: hypothetical protein EPN91_08320 [Salinibacterium sp.]|nr:MAG: hypothetical protein EPN91_08320 [Salinibacterium sp.]